MCGGAVRAGSIRGGDGDARLRRRDAATTLKWRRCSKEPNCSARSASRRRCSRRRGRSKRFDRPARCGGAVPGARGAPCSACPRRAALTRGSRSRCSSRCPGTGDGRWCRWRCWCGRFRAEGVVSVCARLVGTGGDPGDDTCRSRSRRGRDGELTGLVFQYVWRARWGCGPARRWRHFVTLFFARAAGGPGGARRSRASSPNAPLERRPATDPNARVAPGVLSVEAKSRDLRRLRML